MLISIVIPHLNQPEHLERCLASLHAQEGSGAHIEIFVVDNGSETLPEAICAKWPDVTLLSEAEPGPGPARNKGISAARGDILAFIDADCRAHPNWLQAIQAALSAPDVKVIGGDVQVPIKDERHPTALECYERIYAYRNRKYIASGYSGTGNLAMLPETFAQVGPFAGINLAEDRDWGHRARAKGIITRYVPEMIIYHPAREEFSEMQQKWDRHILHDFSHVEGAKGKLRWLARAIAVGLSPAGELPRVLVSDRVSGLKQRWLAFRCLTRIRLFRARRMLSLLFRPKGRSAENVWNR